MVRADTQQTTQPKSHPWMKVLAAFVCAEGLFIALFVSPVSHGIDFYHLNFVPPAVRSGVDVYDAAHHATIVAQIEQSHQEYQSWRMDLCVSVNQRLYASGFCPTATPFLYALHSLMLIGPFDVSYWIFHLAATAAGFLGIYFTARAGGMGRATSWFISGIMNSFCWGLFLDAQLANVSRVQLLSLGIAMMCVVSPKRWAMGWVGVVLAVSCAYKPTIAPSIPLLLLVLAIDGRWTDALKSLVGMLAGGIAALAFPLILFPSLDCWWQWKEFAGHELSQLAATFPGNYSLTAVLAANGQDWMDVLPWALAAVLAAVFCGTPYRRASNPEDLALRNSRLCLALSLGPLWTILASPLTWVQYSALSMPVAVVMTATIPKLVRHRGQWLSLVFAFAALAGGLVPRFVQIESHHLECGLFWVGWIGLLILAVGMIASAGPTKPSTVATRVSGFCIKSPANWSEAIAKRFNSQHGDSKTTKGFERPVRPA